MTHVEAARKKWHWTTLMQSATNAAKTVQSNLVLFSWNSLQKYMNSSGFKINKFFLYFSLLTSKDSIYFCLYLLFEWNLLDLQPNWNPQISCVSTFSSVCAQQNCIKDWLLSDCFLLLCFYYFTQKLSLIIFTSTLVQRTRALQATAFRNQISLGFLDLRGLVLLSCLLLAQL